MKYEVISFDLQGTLSDTGFSDEFWSEVLPELYAEKNKISTQDSKQYLKDYFSQIGRYDEEYYSLKHWLKTLDLEIEWKELVKRIKTPPHLFQDIQDVVRELQKRCPLLLFSATSHEFIYHELGELETAFSWIISAIDDLQVAGKPPEAYTRISKRIRVPSNRILHVGDDYLMDIENAQSAGWNAFHISSEVSREENIRRLCEYIEVKI